MDLRNRLNINDALYTYKFYKYALSLYLKYIPNTNKKGLSQNKLA